MKRPDSVTPEKRPDIGENEQEWKKREENKLDALKLLKTKLNEGDRGMSMWVIEFALAAVVGYFFGDNGIN